MSKTAEQKSLIKADYRAKYAANGGFADDLGQQVSAFVKGENGKTDAAKLRALAEANGAWDERYATLNPGMARMNVSNRLRTINRKGGKVVFPDAEPPKKRRGRPRKVASAQA